MPPVRIYLGLTDLSFFEIFAKLEGNKTAFSDHL